MEQEPVTNQVPQRKGGFGKYILIAAVGAGLFVGGFEFGRSDFSFGAHSGSSKSQSLPAQLDYSSVNELYKELRKNYDGKLNSSQLIEGMKTGLAEAANDPYTEYFSAQQAQEFDNQLNNTFSGIGAELGKDKDGNIIVVSPIKGFPAAKAGLKAQDIIATVDGKSTQGFSIEKAVSVIRGKKGTTVRLQIIRDGEQLEFKIVRDDIKIPSVTSEITKDNIGYIQIATFGDDTAALVDKAATSFADKKVKGIVLDLRGNPGGLVTAAISTASQWLPENTLILQQKRGNTVIEQDNSQGSHRLVGIPTVVLINAGSASASEITAGALHDNKAAYIVGEKSFGKGVVQQLINLKDGGELKVTVASWYRPNGHNINKKGITPDRVVKLTDANVKAGVDTQKNAAIQYLLKK